MKKILLFSALVGTICLVNKANAQEGYYQNQNNDYANQPAYNNQQNYNNDQQGYDNNQQVYYGDNVGYNNNYAVYNNDNDYYYMPDADAYYDVARSIYFYQDGGRWLTASCLPARFGGYAYNRGVSYRINGRMPFMHNEMYRSRYAGGFNRGGGNRNDHGAYAANFDHRNYAGNGGEGRGRNFGGGRMMEQHNFGGGNGGGNGFHGNNGAHNFNGNGGGRGFGGNGGGQGHRR